MSSSMRNTQTEASCIRPRTIISLGTPRTDLGAFPSTLGLDHRDLYPETSASFSSFVLPVTHWKRFLVAPNLTFPLRPTTNPCSGRSLMTFSVGSTRLVAMGMDAQLSPKPQYHRSECRKFEAHVEQQGHYRHALRLHSWLHVRYRRYPESVSTVTLDPSGKGLPVFSLEWCSMTHILNACRRDRFDDHHWGCVVRWCAGGKSLGVSGLLRRTAGDGVPRTLPSFPSFSHLYHPPLLA